MARNEKILIGLLRVCGSLMLLAFPAAAMPSAWMDQLHKGLLDAPLPHGPIVEYLARSASLLYGLNGVGTLVIAADVRRYSPLVRLWGLAHLLGGLALIAIDLTAGLPGLWVLGEGPVLIPIGVATLLLERSVRMAT
ncbi:MAG: hypothetical protein GXP27_00905 [Planctomycetes bacterium]|nr:hypothetical protein [Planctomycetota bacterium]